jgi:hypothetical protein
MAGPDAGVFNFSPSSEMVCDLDESSLEPDRHSLRALEMLKSGVMRCYYVKDSNGEAWF